MPGEHQKAVEGRSSRVEAALGKRDIMKKRFRFENLTVWQDARLLNREVYQLTQRFPAPELFAMTSQVRRASVSVSSNIAEGSGRNSDKDFAHFLEQAYGSLMELASLFYLALDQGYISEADLNQLFDLMEKLAAGIAALNRTLEVKTSKTPFKRSSRTDAVQPVDPRPSTVDPRPPLGSSPSPPLDSRPSTLD